MLKVIEVLSESPKSWEAATQDAITYVGKTVKNIRSVYVQDFSVTVDKNKITHYRVNVKVTFEVDSRLKRKK
jgi:dodecin